ncbi:SDR family oxidoreductase [Ruficoccus sp. ZRK36]|uniref:enoyl-ACP reductase FabI n=1 Tax=Ruficoccus sp. ZRK36 TaxID=2866311 RepID=UPI001C73B501|nr:SDR family oxidoreductase [Ruficoccus sp. ZRK36]QYY35177.1 SDR family oxidoreductase [Ruficoccus sp. ZRK36]
MSFLDLTGKTFLITGVANRKSVAWHIAKILEGEGAKVVYSVRSEERRESTAKLLDGRPVYVCDVEDEAQINALAEAAGPEHGPFHGLVHSIAFANFSAGPQPFHGTRREDFLQATTISCFSLVELARAFKPYLDPAASVVAIGISSQVTAENYGYLSPIKAALDSATRFLAKSFSADTEVRFNTVNPGPLKTSASAGIPGYLENYLFAEKLTLRKKAVTTQEVANTAAFLLSPCSSGINGQSLVVNAGMDMNYFDREVIDAAMRPKV